MFLLKKLRAHQRIKQRSSAPGGRDQQVSLSAQLLLFNYLAQFHGAPPAVQTACWLGKIFKLHLKVCYLTPDSKRMLWKFPNCLFQAGIQPDKDIEKPSSDIIYGSETLRKHS